jgi:hypothetical protein
MNLNSLKLRQARLRESSGLLKTIQPDLEHSALYSLTHPFWAQRAPFQLQTLCLTRVEISFLMDLGYLRFSIGIGMSSPMPLPTHWSLVIENYLPIG